MGAQDTLDDLLADFDDGEAKLAVARKNRVDSAREREQRDADLQAVMSTPHGRRFALTQLEGIDASAFSTNGMDFARREGWRERAIHLHRRLDQLCPDLLALARKEERDARDEGK